MTLEPLFDTILVSPDERKETTEGGLTIPDNASFDRPQKGKVEAIGPKVDSVKVGDEIVYKKYSPDVVKIDGKDWTLLSQSDVLAVVKQ